MRSRRANPSAAAELTRAGAVDVALHQMAAERLAGPQGGLEIDPRARLEVAERGHGQRLVHHVGLEAGLAGQRDRQTDAVDRNRVAGAEAARDAGAHPDASAAGGALHLLDGADLADDAGEHAVTTPAAALG